MTLIQIWAFLSVLTAFGIPQPTIDQIQAILISPQASTTPVVIVPVIQTQPTFGTVNNSPPTQTEVVQSPVMDTTPIITVSLSKDTAEISKSQDFDITATIDVKDAQGVEYPYSVVTGAIPRLKGAKGTNILSISGDNISYWEIKYHEDVAQGQHAPNYPFPIVVTSGETVSTTTIAVQ